MNRLILFCFLAAFAGYSSGARILAIVPTPSYSHQAAFHQIWRELSLRGHQVTLLTTDPLKDPALTNLTEIDLHFAYDLWDTKHNFTNLIEVAQESSIAFVQQFLAALKDIAEQELLHPQVQKLIKKEDGQQFDLVMAEFFHPTMYAFADLYECPLIGIGSMEVSSRVYHSLGNPSHPVLHPEITLPFVTPLNFMERIISTLYTSFLKIYAHYAAIPQQTAVIRKYFGDNFTSMDSLESKLSLFFVNVDPIFHVVRPLVPAIIPIGGGSHIKASKPLPKHLKEFLDDGTEGVVYFSLGTNVKRANIRDHTMDVILKTFADIPYKVLWKIDANGFANKSENVMISRWLPQQDVLKHPNVKLFITQGGWQSIEESIYSHTPMLGLPFFGDQPTNIKNMVAKGIALSLDHKTMTKDDFKGAIMELMQNSKYKNHIQKMANLAQDQPMTGLERAVWWTEYVLRHKGAEHLRSPAIDLPFYQYYLLDVLAFLTAVLLVLVYILVRIVKILFKIARYTSSTGKKIKVL